MLACTSQIKPRIGNRDEKVNIFIKPEKKTHLEGFVEKETFFPNYDNARIKRLGENVISSISIQDILFFDNKQNHMTLSSLLCNLRYL